MAIKKEAGSSSYRIKYKRRNPGVNSKAGTSRSKHSKNYRKPYVGQGR